MTYSLKYEQFSYPRQATQCLDLIEAHYKDTSLFLEYNVPLNIDFVRLENLILSGQIKGIVGKDKHGNIKSIYLASISSYIFSKDKVVSNSIVWCLDKEYRTRKHIRELIVQMDLFKTKYHIDISYVSSSYGATTRLLEEANFNIYEHWCIK